MYNKNNRLNKFRISKIIQIGFLFLLIINTHKNAFAKTPPINRKVSFDKNPVLISDSLKKTDAKLLANSSLDKLSENIYFSSLNNHFSLVKVLPQQNGFSKNSNFLEILALSKFYDGKLSQAEQILIAVFKTTTDSLQKAKICLNLIKISYLNNQPLKAMHFVKTAKDSLSKFYNYKQKYELIFTEARIALTQGLTAKAENLIIARALPMSNRVKGKHNELNCYLFLGKIYLKAGQLTQAKWFFIQANTLAVNQNYIAGKIETSLLLAKTKIKVGDKTVALQDLAKAKRLIDKNHSIYLADLEELTNLARK